MIHNLLEGITMKRRSLFTAAGLGLLAPAALSACGQQQPSNPASATSSSDGPSTGGQVLETLRVHVPTTLAFMTPMASFGTKGKTSGLVGKVDVQNWASTDVLKSLLINGGTDLAATPSYASANLFNKGVPVRLVAITVWGMLYVVGPEGSAAQGIEALRGKKIAVPLPNNMPDLVFRYLMKQQKSDPGFEAVSYEQTQAAVNALLKREVDFAVLPEHVATLASAKAKKEGRTLERTLNLQQLWAQVTGGKPRFPMAGVVMPAKLADANPALVGGVLSELEAAVAEVNSLAELTIKAISDKTEVPPPVVKEVIPRLQLEVVPAQKAKAELEDFYTRLSELSPDVVGGKMPAAEFYAADPR